MLQSLIRSLFIFLPLATTSLTLPIYALEESTHREIQAEQLKAWYDQKKPMTVLDARSKAYFDGRLLPNAIWLPSDSSEATVKETLPKKDALIVVYCLGVKCPASGWLYEKLIAMGYTNVFEYHKGLEDWSKKGYPIAQQ